MMCFSGIDQQLSQCNQTANVMYIIAINTYYVNDLKGFYLKHVILISDF